MYTVASFVKPKREDWDNGCAVNLRADLDNFRYERTRSPMADIVREYLGTEEGGTP